MSNPEHVFWLRKGPTAWNEWRQSVPNIKPDFSNEYFNIQILSHADLSNSNFSNTDLSNVDFSNSNLSYANLSNANLDGANISNANLNSANLDNAVIRKTNLIGANLSGASLIQATLREVDLISAHLSNANLENIRFSGANLNDANLSGANLSRADIRDSDLTNTELRQAMLRFAFFTNTDLSGADLTEADFQCTHFHSVVTLNKARLNQANLTQTRLAFTDLIESFLHEANLSNAYIHDCDLSHANLDYANLSGVTVFRSRLRGMSARYAILDGETRILTPESEVNDHTDFTGVGLGNARMPGRLKSKLNRNIRKLYWEGRPCRFKPWWLKKYAEVLKAPRDRSSWETYGRFVQMKPRWLPELILLRFLLAVPIWFYWTSIWLFWQVSDYGNSTKRLVFAFFSISLFFSSLYVLPTIPVPDFVTKNFKIEYEWGALDGTIPLWITCKYPWVEGIDKFTDDRPDGTQVTVKIENMGFRFLRSFYFSVVTMTTLGFGGHYPTSLEFDRTCTGDDPSCHRLCTLRSDYYPISHSVSGGSVTY